jgi:hypothetical protein
MNNLLLNYYFLFILTNKENANKFLSTLNSFSAGTLLSSTRSTEFINSLYPFFSVLAKQYSGLSCFYQIDKNYFNVFNRDRLLMILFLITFILLRKF